MHELGKNIGKTRSEYPTSGGVFKLYWMGKADRKTEDFSFDDSLNVKSRMEGRENQHRKQTQFK